MGRFDESMYAFSDLLRARYIVSHAERKLRDYAGRGGATARLIPPVCLPGFVVAGGCTRAEPSDDAHPAARGTASAPGSQSIHVDQYMYNPGHRLVGIGEKLEVASKSAEEWQANHPGKTIRT